MSATAYAESYDSLEDEDAEMDYPVAPVRGALEVDVAVGYASGSGELGVISIVTLIIGATSTFGELQSDLDRIWHAPEAVKPAGLWGMLRTRVLSFGLVVSIGFLLLVSLVVSAALAALGTWWGSWFAEWHIVLLIVNQVVTLAFVTALFALMYRILPSVKVGWHDVWYGSFATAILFTVGKFAIGMYLGKAGVASGFGAAGSIVVLLVWLFYSAQIFLLGAEFTWLFAQSHGSRANQPADAATADEHDQQGAHGIPAPVLAAAAGADRPERSASGAAGEFAIAGLVWFGFGLVRSLLGGRGKSKRDVAAPSRRGASDSGPGWASRSSSMAFWS